jgi:predicted dehydrogenase
MKAIRTGVLGAGHLGYHHARNYHALEGVELVGVADTGEDARCRAAEAFSVAAVEDVETLIALEPDAVSVVTPTSSHYEGVAALLDAGIHVLVEKPIASTLEEAEKMVGLAAEKNLILQVGHIERFNGAVMALFDALKTPRFIECHRLSPFAGRGADVSVVLDLMIHDLDIVLTLDKSDVVSIDAVGVSVFSDTEDIANARIRFASGCVANVTSSRVSVDRMRKIRIFEANAYVSTDYSAQEVLVYRKKAGALREGVNPMALISIEPLPVRKDEPLKLELASFADCVRNGAPPVVSGEDGVKALKLARDIVDFIREHS